jgi:hypothetical protein
MTDLIKNQAAEIDRLKTLIDATAEHWMTLQFKHPIEWDGAIDGAMAAACAEIEKLREAVKEIKDAWDWWQVDTYDRCASVVDDAISAALGETK